MIISFGWTSQYLPPKGTKCVTRRRWAERTIQAWQRSFDADPTRRHIAVNKCLAYGGKSIGSLTLTARPYLERLADMPHEDLVHEGGMCNSVQEFIDRYFDGDSDRMVTVIRFKFTEFTQLSIL
jgi:hypothetical protein